MENFLLNRDVNFVEKNMVIEYGDKKIKFCNNILQVIQKYVQSERKSCEAGGILIGRENCGNSNLIIEFITEPMRVYMVIWANGIHIRKIFLNIHL